MTPPKVLQVVGVLDRWSVESWLLDMLRRIKERNRPVDWTFYCAFAQPGSKDDEARALGAKVIHASVPIGEKWKFITSLRAELKRGNYDVLHSHHDLVSAVYLGAAVGLPIRRLVHVHNADESMLTPNSVKAAIMRPLFRRTCLALADGIIANSGHSLDTFLAGRPRSLRRHVIHYLGIDATRFESFDDGKKTRVALNIDPSAPVLLFAGRMTPEKNPVFVVDVLTAIRRKLPDTVAIFAGEGSLVNDVRARVSELGQEDAVRILGWCDNVPEIMAASDFFILPHPHNPPEGFGVAVVEAQLAGLRMLLSEGIKDDPLLPTATFRRLSLEDGAEAWAKAFVDMWPIRPPSRAAALAAFHRSPMDMDHALDNFLEFYK